MSVPVKLSLSKNLALNKTAFTRIRSFAFAQDGCEWCLEKQHCPYHFLVLRAVLLFVAQSRLCMRRLEYDVAWLTWVSQS